MSIPPCISSLLAPEEDLTGISAHDPMFPMPLTHENVLDYFSATKFYDPSCNNQVVKMQRLHPDAFKQMTGIEFVVQSHERVVDPKTNISHELWTIRKQYRESPDKEHLLSLYYIVDQVIYQAPDILTLCESRFMKSVTGIHSSLMEMFQMIQFDTELGHLWKPDGQTQNEVTTPRMMQHMDQKQSEQMERLIPLLEKRYMSTNH